MFERILLFHIEYFEKQSAYQIIFVENEKKCILVHYRKR